MAKHRSERSSATIVIFIILKIIFYAFALFTVYLGLTSDTPQMAIVGFILAGIPGYSAAKAIFSKAKGSVNTAQYDYEMNENGDVREINKFAVMIQAIVLFFIGCAVGIIATPIIIILDIVELVKRGKNKN